MRRFRHAVQKYGHWIFFAVIILITVYMDVYIAANILDGDASDFMNHGRVIAEQNNPFTRDFSLTTEVRLISIPTIFAFFFELFSDWTLVRILGTIVIQAFYVCCFLYLCKQSGISRPASLYAAGMLLLPFSLLYARIVLYHLYYILYLSNVFWIMGLMIRQLNVKDLPVRKALPSGFLLAGIWFYAGLYGIRYMLIIGLPLLLFTAVQFLLTLKDYTWENGRLAGNEPFMKTDAVRLLGIVVCSFFFYAIGFVISSAVLQPYFGVKSMSGSFFIPAWEANHYSDVLNGWLLATGIRISTLPLVGIRGLSMAACLFGFGYLLTVSIRSCFEKKSIGAKLMHSMLGISFVTTTLVFCFEYEFRVHELYYVPVISMAACAFAHEFNRFKDRALSISRRLFVLLACACFLFQSAYSLYFLRVEKTEMDAWSGLFFRQLDAVDRVSDCVEYMEENGYTHALIDYWYAAPMIEISDGALRVSGHEGYSAKDQTISVYRWGTCKSDFAPENLPEKVLMFLERGKDTAFASAFPNAPLCFEGWIFNAYEVDSSMLR